MPAVLDQADIGSNSASGTATTIVLTTNQNVAVGATIFLLIHSEGTPTITVAGGGLTWTEESVMSADPTTALFRADAPSGLASGASVTATFSVTSTSRIIAGCSFTGVLAKEDSDANFLTSDPAWTSNSLTATSQNNLVISAVTNNFQTGHTPTAPNLDAVDTGASFDYQFTIVYRINDAAGSYTNSGAYDTGGGLVCIATAAYGATASAGYKRLYGPALLTGSAATLYTCPASTVTRVLHIHVSNPSAGEVDLNLSIGADAAATRVYDDFPLVADSVEHNFDPYELAVGETIQGWASDAATVVLTITGYERPA